MTYTAYNYQSSTTTPTSSEDNQEQVQVSSNPALTGTFIPDPKYFPELPVNNQIDTNAYSGAPYYYDYARRSWIFYIPGTTLSGS